MKQILRTALVSAALLTFWSAGISAKEVHLNGRITESSVHSIVNQLEPGDTLVLNSPGGHQRQAEILAGRIRYLRINTKVGTAKRCASACLLVFSAGERRSVDSSAELIWHESTDQSTGDSIPYGTSRTASFIAARVGHPSLKEKLISRALWAFSQEEICRFGLVTEKNDCV